MAYLNWSLQRAFINLSWITAFMLPAMDQTLPAPKGCWWCQQIGALRPGGICGAGTRPPSRYLGKITLGRVPPTLWGSAGQVCRLTHQEGRFYNGHVLRIEKAEARRGARLSRAERVTVTVTDPCEPDLGNSSGGSGA